MKVFLLKLKYQKMDVQIHLIINGFIKKNSELHLQKLKLVI